MPTRSVNTLPANPERNVLVALQVHQICSNDEMIGEYDQLFSKGFQSVEQLHTEFESAFGDSYAYEEPALLDLIDQAHDSVQDFVGPDLAARRDICSSDAMASAMRLDQIVRGSLLPAPLLGQC